MEGVSTGELLMRRYLDLMLPRRHIDNFRPDWLRSPITGQNLELDRYYPDLRIGFEFQGDQHFRHTDLDSATTQRNDAIKRRMCKAAGVKLVIVRAIDLEYTHMSSKIKPAHAFRRLNKKERHLNNAVKYALLDPERAKHISYAEYMRRLRALNDEGTAYRAYLRERFPAGMTARTKRVRIAKAKEPWVDTYKSVPQS